ncbi:MULTISPECIES: DUF4369 domain-containing protein [Butyricimonas]|uniref:DUF4369 domain-containing protein n=1 Tax=Butyricimonas TaxID=574697 RepID=UPI0007FB594F|nr:MULTISPECIES: DUF4369 domain-containing protein [Butyricimonas]
MKKIVLMFLACVAFGFCYAQDGYRIKGKLINGDSKEAYLIVNEDTIARAEIKNGMFEFVGKVDEAIYTVLSIDGMFQMIPVFLENTNFNITVDWLNANGSIVEGGIEQKIFQTFREIESQIGIERLKCMGIMQNTEDQKLRDSAHKEMSNLSKLQQAEENKVIQANPDAAASAMMVSVNVDLFSLKFSKERFNLLSEKGRATRYGKIAGEAIALKERTAIGAIAPDFELESVEGKVFKMSDVKAKVKVLMFWKPSVEIYREKSDYIMPIYNEYKDKGLEIISISREEDRDVWEKIVKEDKRPWKEGYDWKNGVSSVLELYGGKEHNVSHLYVLDENNKIIYDGVPYNSFRTCMERLFKK